MAVVHAATRIELYGGAGSIHGWMMTGTWIESHDGLPWHKQLGKPTWRADVGYDDRTSGLTQRDRFTIRKSDLVGWCLHAEWDPARIVRIIDVNRLARSNLT